MSSVIDYSKWDNIDVSDSENSSDNDDEEQFQQSHPDAMQVEASAAHRAGLSVDERLSSSGTGPKVYRVNPGSTVTFGGGETTVHEASHLSPGPLQDAKQTPASTAQSRDLATRTSSKKSDDGEGLEKYTKNGGSCEQYMWRQTADQVDIYFLIDHNLLASGECQNDAAHDDAARVPTDSTATHTGGKIRSKEVSVSLPTERSLCVMIAERSLWHKELFAPVILDDYVDWQLVETPRGQCVLVSLSKKPLMAAVRAIWWPSVEKARDEDVPRSSGHDSAVVDVERLPGRSKDMTQRAQAFSQALSQATEEFKKRVKQRKKVEID